MEIEFNTGLVPQVESSQLTVRRNATPPLPGPVSFSSSDSLNSQLSQLSSVRPEQVDRARALVADESYPSDDVLKQVADKLTIPPDSQSNGQSG